MSWYSAFQNQSHWDTLKTISKVLLYAVALLVIVTLIGGLRQDGYIIETFRMPQSYMDAGVSGEVLAMMIVEEYEQLKEDIKSSKEDNMTIGVSSSPDLNLQIMGFGFSTNSLSYHLKELFNIPVNSIGGNMVDIDSTLRLTLRMSGYEPLAYEVDYSEWDRLQALDEIVDQAAEGLLENTDPYRLAVHRYQRKEYAEAENIIRGILRKHPDDKKWAYLAWGNLKLKQQQEDMAQEFYQEALAIDPNFANAQMAQGWMHYTHGDYEEAIRYFEKLSTRNDKNRFGSINGLAYANMSLGNLDRAEEYFQMNVKNSPKNIWAYQNYSYFMLNTKKDTAGSLRVLQQAGEELGNTADYYVALSSKYGIQNEVDSAYHYARKGLQYDPENVGCLQTVINYHYYKEDNHEALNQYLLRLNQVYKEGEYDAFMRMRNLNLLAITDYKRGEYELSLIHAQEAIDLIPSNPYPYSTKAEAYALMDNHEAFYTEIEKALERGLPLNNFMDQEPYIRYQNDPRLKSLIKKYTDQNKLLG